MELTKKIKIGLDETRMLILGAQILLGFQLREVFGDAFDELPPLSRHAEVAGLALMTVTVALLIAPGPYHRLVYGGRDDPRLQPVITAFAEAALMPFALALGIDLYIALGRVFGMATGLAAGGAAALLALAAWYGLPYAARQWGPSRETRMPAGQGPPTPLAVRIEQMLTEARVVLPGGQALLGFQLAIVLTRGFEQLPKFSQAVHAVSLGLVALAVVLLMAPAAYHRIVFGGEEDEAMHRAGSLMLTAATLPLAMGLAGDIYVVIAKIAASPATGAAAGAVPCCCWSAFGMSCHW